MKPGCESDRVYFRVLPESPVMPAIDWAAQKGEAFRQACKALADKSGGKVWISGPFILGIAFPGPLAEGWRPQSNKPYAVPNRRTLAGKRIAADLDSIKGVDVFDFCARLMGALKAAGAALPRNREGFTYFADRWIMWTVPERCGQQWLLSVPVGCKIDQIPGCIKLKMSEYRRIREEAEAPDSTLAATPALTGCST